MEAERKLKRECWLTLRKGAESGINRGLCRDFTSRVWLQEKKVMDGEQDEQQVEREQSENSVAVESDLGNWLGTLS